VLGGERGGVAVGGQRRERGFERRRRFLRQALRFLALKLAAYLLANLLERLRHRRVVLRHA